MKESLKYSILTNGKFDITVYPLVKAWDVEKAEIPSKEEIREALIKTGYSKIKIRGQKVILKKDMAIGLGGIAKGYAVDRACEILREEGVTEAF